MSNVQDSVGTKALCWRVERSDGAGFALTSHDVGMRHWGVDCAPAPGMMPASVTRSLGLDPNDSEIAGAISSDALEVGDLAQGRWDGARIALDVVDWTDPDLPAVTLIGGSLGAVSIRDEEYRVTLSGASAGLDEPVCPSTSAQCRAAFGDRACRVDLAGRILRARIVSADGNALQIDEAIDGDFLFGRLLYLSGDNCGLETLIVSAAGPSIRVRDLPRATIEPGCVVELRHGCDKIFATCRDRFENAVNFRGEPHLPGNDLLTRNPGV